MKRLLSGLSLLTVLLAGNVRAENLSCALAYSVKGGGIQAGLGYFKLKGKGTITCMGLHGEQTKRNVKITIGGHPLAARAAIGYFKIKGVSGSFGFSGSIDDLYGNYMVADAQAAAGIGAGTSLSLQSPKNGVRMALGIDASVGLGIQVGMSVMTVEPDRTAVGK